MKGVGTFKRERGDGRGNKMQSFRQVSSTCKVARDRTKVPKYLHPPESERGGEKLRAGFRLQYFNLYIHVAIYTQATSIPHQHRAETTIVGRVQVQYSLHVRERGLASELPTKRTSHELLLPHSEVPGLPDPRCMSTRPQNSTHFEAPHSASPLSVPFLSSPHSTFTQAGRKHGEP